MMGRCFLNLIVLLMFATSPCAAEPGPMDGTIGAVTLARGRVVLKQPGRGNGAPAERGATIRVGDVISTEPDGKCQIALADDSFMNLDVSTSVRVHQFSFDRRSSRRTAVVRVVEGTARIVVFKPRPEGSHFTVESQTASVIAGSTADFVVTAAPESTDIAVLEHAVTVSNIVPVYVGAYRVDQNMRTTVKRNHPPAKPEFLGKTERQGLLNRLTNF